MKVFPNLLGLLCIVAAGTSVAQQNQHQQHQNQNWQNQQNQNWQNQNRSHQGNIKVVVDGKTVMFPDVQPMMTSNRVMVPLRGVFEEIGASVHWNATTQTVTAMRGGTEIILKVGNHMAEVNGQVVHLDAPAVMHQNRTLVPLRFLSETLGADVDWNPTMLTVLINTTSLNINPTNPNTRFDPPPTGTGKVVNFAAGAVIPFTLNTKLSSNTSARGDRFVATLDTEGDFDYAGLPKGTIVEGRVDTVREKTSDMPGVLGLTFDRIKLPNGNAYNIDGSLIGLDNNSVETRDGKLYAKPGAKKDVKYVGIGAGAGALIAIITKENILTSTLIGAALGYLYDEIRKDPSKSRDVVLEPGTRIGLRLDRDTSFRLSAANK